MVSSRASLAAADTDLVAAPGAGGIQLPQGSYEVAMRFEVPRAQPVAWTVICPGVTIDGQVGERGANSPTTLVASARVITSADGVCGLRVTADDANVRAAYTISRIRDLDTTDRMRTISERQVAVQARGELTAQLVTNGADPGAPDARDQASDDNERRRREARLDADAQRAQYRDQAALRARAVLSAQLVALGAKARPPMPPPKHEEPGAPPYAGAEWISGYWSWESGDWLWYDGAWYDEEHDFDANLIGADAGAGIHNKRTYEDYPSRPFLTGVRDHRKKRDRDRDHRSGPVTAGSGSFLDGIKSVSDNTTRDHRNNDDSSHNARREWVPRDADDKKDDDKPERVRDHRR